MSVIYKISCKDETITDSYIGSTINIHERKIQHKFNCNNENSNSYNFKLYKFIRENGGFDNWNIEIIDELEMVDTNEMRDIERKYIEDKDNNATLNSEIPNRKKNEYYNDNKEKYKKYYAKNSDNYKKYNKLRYEQKKEYFKEYHKQYQNENKETIRQRQNKKINCNICNSLISRANIIRHQKSKKCNNIRLELLKLYFNIWKK